MEKRASAPSSQLPRAWGLDLLRILAAFTVVVRHANPQAYLEVEVASASWNVMNVVASLCSWNVSAFWMISGALFLDPNREGSIRRLYRKNIFRLAVSFAFWSAFYALADCVLTGRGKWTFLNQLFRGHYHMWYLFALIGLYAVTPLLRKITESRRLTEYFLLSGFLLSFLLGRFIGFVQLLNPPHADVWASLQAAYAQVDPYRGLSALYDYVLGYYLFAYPLGKGARRALYASGVLGFGAMVGLTAWHSRLTGTTSSFFSSNASLGVLLMTAAVFVFFKETFSRVCWGKRLKALVRHASRCTFGIYLVHAFVLERLSPSYPSSPGALLGHLLGVSLAVYLIAYAVSAALNRVPMFRKTIV